MKLELFKTGQAHIFNHFLPKSQIIKIRVQGFFNKGINLQEKEIRRRKTTAMKLWRLESRSISCKWQSRLEEYERWPRVGKVKKVIWLALQNPKKTTESVWSGGRMPRMGEVLVGPRTGWLLENLFERLAEKSTISKPNHPFLLWNRTPSSLSFSWAHTAQLAVSCHSLSCREIWLHE